MKWRYKAAVQNCISRLPMSDAIYYALQRYAGDLRPGRFDPMEWVHVTSEMLDWLHGSGQHVRGARVLEVGTGRALGMPVALWLCGAEQIVTVDLNRYLIPTLVWDCNRYYRLHGEEIAELLRKHDLDGGLSQRMRQLATFSGDLGAFMKMIHVEYYAPADARQLSFPDHSFDFHFSYSVLEHVPAPEILSILREGKRLLRPGGTLLHTIDLSDHFWYGDSSIPRLNFLRFSEGEWQRWANNKYMYQNRLRASEFLRLFADAGLQIKAEWRTQDERCLQLLRNGFPVHPRFSSFRVEELAIIAMQITAEVPREGAGGISAQAGNSHPIRWRHLGADGQMRVGE